MGRCSLGCLLAELRLVERFIDFPRQPEPVHEHGELACDRYHGFVPPNPVLAVASKLETPASEVALFTERTQHVLGGLDG